MTDIKIFVSNRIDFEAEVIRNSLFVPIRCGAIYDKSDSSLIGDDTGNNISSKRMSFNELTVLYWAWKNQKADYYGLCHYRRYLSFIDSDNKTMDGEKNNGCIAVEEINDNLICDYGLTEDIMRPMIESYDAIFVKPIDLRSLKLKSNYDAMKKSEDYHKISDIDKMLEIISKKYPDMLKTAKRYMYNYEYSYLYNCFIMKADIFNMFCSWLFDILFELEKQIDMSLYSEKQYRTPGTIAERLLGIWALWMEEQKKYKIKNLPLLFIEHPQKKEEIKPLFKENSVVITSNFNDKYAPIFSVFLKSLISFSDDNKNYDIILLCSDISMRSKELINEIIKEHKNISVRYTDPTWSLRGVRKVLKDRVYTEDLYYRIMIPYILKNFDKAIVVDADMLCREDIATVWNEDINNCLAGAVKDVVFMGYLNGMVSGTKEYCNSYMKLNDPYSYVNTGFLLFNLEKFRKTYSFDYLRSFIIEHMGKVRIYEQDMLNMLLNGNLKFLDPKWNCYTYPNSFIEDCLKLAPYEDVNRWRKARNSNTGILHYASHPKPWWEARSDLAYLWWNFARQTPFYEEFLQEAMNYVYSYREPKSQKTKKARWKLLFQLFKYSLYQYFSTSEYKKHCARKKTRLKKKLEQDYDR